MIIIDCEQQSPEWFAIKAGIPSAGSAKEIVTEKGEPYKSQTLYADKLADEAIRGHTDEGYQSKAMKTGSIRERESRIVYELDHIVDVQEMGFIFNDSKKYGCSPDGIINNSYGIEMKNPLGKTHVKYLREGKLPTGVGYVQQIQMSLLVTGFDRWDFMSYCPGHSPFYVRVERDEVFIKKLEEQLEGFCFKLAKLIKKLKGG